MDIKNPLALTPEESFICPFHVKRIPRIEKHLHDDCPGLEECNKVEFGFDESPLAIILRPILIKFGR